MEAKWIFPSSNFGITSGISNAGIETFQGNKYGSLAKEICQNSMDARLNEDSPVRVEFELMKTDISLVPGISELKEVLNACFDRWKSNRKTANFLKKAIETVSKDEINILRISDFNTTGLEGSEGERDSAWENLVKSSGVSDKGDTAGGSFGIGKSAPFACSTLRTVFYSTLDRKGVKASQGVANLVSFDINCFNDKEEDMSQGIGFYGINIKNDPITELLEFSEFKRVEPGTDIYVLGFVDDSDKEDWIQGITKAVIEDYLISIDRGEIVVKIQNQIIDNTSLEGLIKRYKEDLNETFNYYMVLKSEKTIEYREDFEGLGNIYLRLLLERDLQRRVLMARNNGMKIFDQKNISGVISFAGVCILEGRELNAYFRKMETPQHNKWESQRHDEPKEAEKKRLKLFRLIKSKVEELGTQGMAEEMDVLGADRFVPDLIDSDRDSKVENMEDNVFNFKMEKMNIDAKRNRYNSQKGDDEEDDIDNAMEDEEGNEEGFKRRNSSGINVKEGNFAVSSGEGELFSKSAKKKMPLKIRLFIVNDRENIYKSVFSLDEESENTEIRVYISGDSLKSKVFLSEAYNSEEKLRYSLNRIYLGKIAKDVSNEVYFKLKERGNFSLEVDIYGD